MTIAVDLGRNKQNDTKIAFLKFLLLFFKLSLKKVSRRKQKYDKLPSMQQVNSFSAKLFCFTVAYMHTHMNERYLD